MNEHQKELLGGKLGKLYAVLTITVIGLVGLFFLQSGCGPSTKTDLQIGGINRIAGVEAHDKDGIKYVRIVSEDEEVIFDSREKENITNPEFYDGGELYITDILGEGELREDFEPGKKYFLEVVDMKGNITRKGRRYYPRD